MKTERELMQAEIEGLAISLTAITMFLSEECNMTKEKQENYVGVAKELLKTLGVIE